MTKTRTVCRAAAVFSCLIALPLTASEIPSDTQTCGIESRNDSDHTDPGVGYSTNSWIIISSILNNLELILYGQGGLELGTEVPIHPYAIQANLDAEAFVLLHKKIGTPSDLGEQGVFDARQEAEKGLALLASNPDLLTDRNQGTLAYTLQLILEDLDA